MSFNFVAGKVVVPASTQAPAGNFKVDVSSTSKSEAVKISVDSDSCSLILPKITILCRLSAALAIKLMAFSNDSRLIDNCMLGYSYLNDFYYKT